MPIQDPRVRDYMMSKFGPEARQKLVDENTEAASGPNWLAGLAALGSGLQGGNAIQAGQSFLQGQQAQREKKLGEFDAGRKLALEDETLGRDREKLARESDPMSEESKLAQQLAAEMGVSKDVVPNLTAAKFKELSPILSKKYEMQQNRLARQDAATARAQELALKRADKENELQMKRDEKLVAADEKKKVLTNEVEQRRQDIKDNLDLVMKQIKDKGTYEAFGPHNQDLERRIEAIATDMAKLQDPSSVARPSEVEAVKQNLIRSGLSNSNSTAMQILKNFEKEVDARANNAYKIRGLDMPMIAEREIGPGTGEGDQQQAAGGEFTEEKKKRLAELRAKKAARVGKK